jgi:hypothetical protein
MNSVFSYASWLENDQASVINDFVDKYQNSVLDSKYVTQMLNDNSISYDNLPQYLKDKLDTIEVY